MPGASSIYSFQPFEQDASFLIIGERTNANGSKRFRESMLEGEMDTLVEMAKDQVAEGSHVLDVCVDYVGRDGTEDMDEIAFRFATQSTVPLVFDSTEPEVMQAGLERFGGRAILNSANLEDGEAEGSRLDRVFSLAAEHGAAVICLLIDEEGQARGTSSGRCASRTGSTTSPPPATASKRPTCCSTRSRSRCPPATTTCAVTGSPRSRRSGASSPSCPGVFTTLGVSNVSFGLKPQPGTCSTRCSSTSASTPGSTRRSCTPARSSRSRASPTSSATSASTSSSTAGAPRAR